MPKLIDDAEVYRAVIELVQKEGYLKTTTKRIAEVADFHETTLFDKYGSKPELVLAALSFHMSNSPMKTLTYTGDIRVDLIAVMEAYQKAITLFGDFINTLILQVPAEPQLSSGMGLLLEDMQPIIEIILRYQARGLLKQEPALQIVGELIAPFFMQHMFSRMLQEVNLPEVDLERRVETFLYGFGVVVAT